MNRTGLRARLAAVASYLPEATLDNAALAREFPDWPASKIVEVTGIESRHVAAADEFTSDLAVKAGRGIEMLFHAQAALSWLLGPVLTGECVRGR